MGFPPQQQSQPGMESAMVPRPIFDNPNYKAAGKLEQKVAIITGGDSGIGRAVAVAFAKEGADVVISYLNEHADALETQRVVERYGGRCVLVPGDIGERVQCLRIVKEAMVCFGRIDVLVNNAGVQFVADDLLDIEDAQLEYTFRTNIFSQFMLTKAVLPQLRPGSSIINTASITAYRGEPQLIDYSSTKGAIVSFTRSLARSLATSGIRVNGVAPGPIWTPLIPASFTPDRIAKFGDDTPMKRAGQPYELAPAYVFLACDDSSYMTGQMLHINGGTIVNG
ncbi:SDR family oxidoreductase [Alicyclobacillus fastidiosus]|uniref:SDR family oxidoreductase n=1 Tax=Alicyclobacillus fastidiosus TaxID=392011 RepID=A0ABV5AD73_9BACL|nr:SDR family oxidoreductase [Alicyclobacillus fastidiosus]WEH08794.1 SDR family oxidoreductase [Alicyclobacillus fastidiosus]